MSYTSFNIRFNSSKPARTQNTKIIRDRYQGIYVSEWLQCMAIKIIYLIQHPVQLIPCLNYSISVIAINDKNKTLSVLEVVPPQWTDLQIETKIIQQSHKPYNYKNCSEGIRNMGAQLSGKIDIQHQPKEDMSTSAVKIK